ncbi:MAG: hypothetical protein QOA14_05415 [Nitrososphaeraceae archaeon]|jgi:hypothetical protein|nr:hypothetical protein [Nitrososphaeraceae archaeon]MDW0168603.1 hypothetical protein [Nitrososphaeraceae archaeon]MDW0171301.1 hypothetical protein [Nitrososphaeraceae archaeon]MDW0173663.1 hypothetical protein [Nitrososphaeraceae archaeon]MDW0176110.1 hypothetical protein [Nitrososphaeraceae archaeon]
MSSEELVLEKILSTGSNGIKKSDLKKEFTSFDLDQTLENLVNNGKVCVDKKGAAYYCWTAEVYVKYLNSVDPKFRILLERIKIIERKLDTQSNSVKDALNGLIEVLKSENSELPKALVNLDNFKIEFDTILSRSTSSIGWIELGNVRSELSQKFDLDKNEFYELVEQLVNSYHNEYELSTGGSEGLILRGLLHGYVRGI